MLSTEVSEIKPTKDNSLSVTLKGKDGIKEKTFEKVLISVGRRPNSDLLNLQATDIELTKEGFINVDVYQQTTVKNIFAIGDIAGNPMLAHKATHEGKVAAEVVCGFPSAMDARAIPSVVYTDPEVAWVGLTESEAQAKQIKYHKVSFLGQQAGKPLL